MVLLSLRLYWSSLTFYFPCIFTTVVAVYAYIKVYNLIAELEIASLNTSAATIEWLSDAVLLHKDCSLIGKVG